jgi:hypothetical protein
MREITSTKIISKEDAVILLDENPKPVIFWDTCALLDIMRMPLPDRGYSLARLKRVMEIKQSIVNGKIISLASKLTLKEFNDNIYEVEDSLFKAEKNISNKFNTFIEFVNLLNPSIAILSIDLNSYGTADMLMDIIESITDETYFIDEDDLFMQMATRRTIDKIPPAKVKGEFKDCYVWSTCLTVRGMSAQAGQPFGFMSSNTSDYADSTKMSFSPEIQTEASLVDILYWPQSEYAYGILKAGGVF